MSTAGSDSAEGRECEYEDTDFSDPDHIEFDPDDLIERRLTPT
jgi:hypothetical protein